MILAGSGIAAGGTGNANFLEIQINIPPQKMIMTPHKMMMTPQRMVMIPQKMMMTPQKMGERLT